MIRYKFITQAAINNITRLCLILFLNGVFTTVAADRLTLTKDDVDEIVLVITEKRFMRVPEKLWEKIILEKSMHESFINEFNKLELKNNYDGDYYSCTLIKMYKQGKLIVTLETSGLSFYDRKNNTVYEVKDAYNYDTNWNTLYDEKNNTTYKIIRDNEDDYDAIECECEIANHLRESFKVKPIDGGGIECKCLYYNCFILKYWGIGEESICL